LKEVTLKELALPLIKAIDSFNYLLKSHHRRVAVIAYNIAKELNLSEKDLSELVIAASMHDIGALSIQERDMLIQEDVNNPKPHCVMGYRMLVPFNIFKNVAQIIKHHHIKYEESLKTPNNRVFFASHIIHLADRVDILINHEEFILNQKSKVTEKIRDKVGITFHPEVFEAFLKVAKADIFWIEINNMSLDQLFRKINFLVDCQLTLDNVTSFALTISRIVDFRSRFTVTHSYTVAHLASFFGTIFNYSEERCQKLMIAGYLHDIGKIGIDPRIIEKSGSLTEEEYNMIKLHPYYTEQILNELSTSEWFAEIANWAKNHHERIDGSGYPYSLTEPDIEEGVKILAFSDVITALMEERPYRKILEIDEAFRIIDETIAPKISIDMFDTIKKHKIEINDLVRKCQQYKFDHYN
jgi:HD-GYP domain-containing protein (c-di-GMP phosphodiesterase class II)